MRADPLERLLSRIDVNAEGCWVWLGSCTFGYGKFWYEDRTRPAHLIAYTLLVGPVSTSLELDHLCHSPDDPTCAGGHGCRHRRCCNPDHLDPVTPRVNTLRSGNRAAVNARKTHCLRGHPFDLTNTRISPSSGQRYCRACDRLAYQRRLQTLAKAGS